MRRGLVVGFLVAGLLAPAAATAQVPPPDSLTGEQYVQDFDALWKFVHDQYAYFHLKQTDWTKVRAHYAPRAAQVTSRRQFVGLLEQVLAELYDPHAHVAVNTAASPRLVPSGTDLRAGWHADGAVITDVRAGSAAEAAGVPAGAELLAIGGRPVRDAAREQLPSTLASPDTLAWTWALQAALAGRRDTPVQIEVLLSGERRRFEYWPERADRQDALLTTSVMHGRFARIRIHDSLGDTALIAAFDSALAAVRGMDGLVLDLRDTPSGGTSTVARGIMSRLITVEQPYQWHELPAEQQRFGVRRLWLEYVAPRGPFTYDGPIIVLVGAWTGSMGEGLAIGLDGMSRATVVGRPMAGLVGAVYDVRLPNTGFVVRIPAERLFHVDGTPREAFLPRVVMERAGTGEDTALEAALRLLAERAR